MLYYVARNGQTYGPYTLDDLRKYVASGNVLPTDLAKSDDMAEWAPVAQVLGGTPGAAPVYAQQVPPAYAAPRAANVDTYPDPPNLSWGLVLLFSCLTCSVFMWVWNIIVASWVRRVQPNSKAIFYYSVSAVLLFLQIVLEPHARLRFEPGYHWFVAYYAAQPLRNLLRLGTWVVRLIARFTMRAELEEHFNTVEPIGLSLSGVMTFFFGGLYFQYHLNRINEMKRMARYRGGPI